ncbi:MAG: DMT family transporter [Thermoleophilia bacterium]|nr:DMT family transporter [Thermoleophilia bacterium]
MSDLSFWVWVLLAFGAAAAWGLTVVVNKRTLQYVDPFALNLLMRVPTIALIAVAAGVLTVTDAWELGFGMTWGAFVWITASAVVTWLVAFNAYYLVLRLGALGVVTPIMATDPLFTAVFAVILLNAAPGPLVIAGLVVSTAGVVLISRWMEPRADAVLPAVALEPLADTGQAGSPPVPPLIAEPVAPLLTEPAPPEKSPARLRFDVIALALLAAAGWGLGPVFIELATESLGAASATMMLQSQAMGLLMLVPIVWRRHRVVVRRLTGPERRLVVRFVLIASVLEAYFAVAYYLLIDEIGSVLTVLIIASSPVFAILGGMRFLGERYSRKLAIGAAVTLVGVVIATLQGA